MKIFFFEKKKKKVHDRYWKHKQREKIVKKYSNVL